MAEILHTQVKHTWLIIRVKIFVLRPTVSQGTFFTDRQRTDGQTTIMPIVRLLLKYGRLKFWEQFLLTGMETLT